MPRPDSEPSPDVRQQRSTLLRQAIAAKSEHMEALWAYAKANSVIPIAAPGWAGPSMRAKRRKMLSTPPSPHANFRPMDHLLIPAFVETTRVLEDDSLQVSHWSLTVAKGNSRYAVTVNGVAGHW
jgi:hypothetical protein